MDDEAVARRWLSTQRVARLATADAASVPSVVPVCFVLSGDEGSLYITIDQKPKDLSRPLKRVRNILANPQVSLVVDHYTEDWSQLVWVMVRGHAEVLEPGLAEHAAAQDLLRGKYLQYRLMMLQDLPVIAVRIARLTWWGRSIGLENETAQQ